MEEDIIKLLNHKHKGTDTQRVNYNDLTETPSIPTSDQLAALAGTSGTPSSTNKYVTNDDVASAATASKVVRRGTDGAVTVPSTPDADTEAASKSYVDTSTNTALYTTASDTTQLRKQSSIDLNTSPGELFRFYLPGTVRTKVYAKSNNESSYSTYYVYRYTNGQQDAADSRITLLQVNINDSYSYRQYDFDVNAGDILEFYCSSSECTDIQINFTVNTISSVYTAEI